MAAHPTLVLAADDLGRIFGALLTGPCKSPGNPNPPDVAAMLRRFDSIPSLADGGSTAQVAERTALIAAMAGVFATLDAQIAAQYAALKGATAALVA